jgi:quercetin dioxygenase-like cupin family protein
MQHWHLPDVNSTDKLHDRERGAAAPRVKSTVVKPQVLFSHPECRAIVIPLAAGDSMNDHVVRQRAIVATMTGHVTFRSDGDTIECRAGSVVDIEPGERHAVDAHEDSRLLLILSPWRDHPHEPDRLPTNATAEPQ